MFYGIFWHFIIGLYCLYCPRVVFLYNNFNIQFMRVVALLKKITNQYSHLQVKRKSEQRIVEKLKQALKPTFVSVENTTLGRNSCGQMFKIVIQSPFFKRMSKVEQHKLVTNALSTEISNIHGFNLKTREPKVQTN